MKREILDSANFGAWKAVVGRNPSLSKWSHGGRRNCASAGPSARWRAIWTDLTLFWPLFLIMLPDIYSKMNRNSRVIPKAVSVGVPYFGEQKWSGEIRQRRKQSHNAHQESTRSAGYLRSYSSVSASGRAHHMPTPRAGLHDQAKESSLWNAYKYIRSDGAFLKTFEMSLLVAKKDAQKRREKKGNFMSKMIREDLVSWSGNKTDEVQIDRRNRSWSSFQVVRKPPRPEKRLGS